MEHEEKIPLPDFDEMKQLVQKKAKQVLNDFTEENLNYFVKEASIIAESILEKYVFAVYDLFVSGELVIKDIVLLETFTNPTNGYQQRMLEWKEQNKPQVHFSKAFLSFPQKSSNKPWQYVTLGMGTAGAIGLGIYCYRDEWAISRCWLVGLAVELLTLSISYYLIKKERNENQKKEQCEQNESELHQKKELFVKETIDSLEKWLKQGEIYSNELLTTYNL